jgi:hypothetical protein
MTRTIVLPSVKRRRGNPNFGKPCRSLPALQTEFEMQVERLGLTTVQFIDSKQLKQWCAHNRNRCYVPEWLLKEWELTVEDIFSGVA